MAPNPNQTLDTSAPMADTKTTLHGDLLLTIHEARRLPNMDMVSERLRRCFTICEPCRAAVASRRNHPPSHHRHRKIITSDPYVTVRLAGATVARTRVIKNSQDPLWNEHFKIPVAHPASEIEFVVKDNDMFGADTIGSVKIPVQDLINSDSIDDWFPILGANAKPPKEDTALHLQIQFVPFEKNETYRRGIAADPEKLGVRDTYFPNRKGNSVTLYQDAHVQEGMLPKIELENGSTFVHNPCWEDICHALLDAHHLIYIVGWSIYHKVKLVRERTKELLNRDDVKVEDFTLGDLLKYKSEEGVRVLLLVWDDKTSHDKFFINTAGVMETHDEETRKFFKHSSVICALSPRYASNAQGPGNKRKVIAFVGGLDLCDGRYDTPEHRLFRDLDTVFQEDYHNPTFPLGTKSPRQPWHDWHSKIDGPAAYDVLKNFEQRWRRATKWSEFGRGFKRLSHWHDDALIKIERISWILSPSSKIPVDHPMLWASSENNPETWHVQVFRSIDSGSVKGFPKNPLEAEEQNLAMEKNLAIDKSIQTAYIQAIRSAQHFIYIENQYFIGSSYGWPAYRGAGADNLIPMELALKIASKIRANERFVVYIVIPMWPEGVPSSASVQEILFWQGQTMHMMYELVAKELKSMQLEHCRPQDYLNFYCLGNREPSTTSEAANQPSSNGDAASAAQKNRRFMIYVHAKGMIVDDEYVIVGSANINQRSLAGSRDTEIAIGAYQPHYTWDRTKHPRGQIYGYRMSLWAEHLGYLEDCFKEPHSIDCVRRVNQIAEDNWSRFTADQVTPLEGHLLKYPIHIDEDGKVGPLPGQDTFPDVGGKILGAHSNLPDALTT
ncbi:hypothetical protein Sjap_009851 [Stephania japonica]|uniref:Phospholipase D n=1 Tax=Stephania japonica TaxID=461633 RepID=A0AAP0J8H9_9MAGN